MFGRLQVVIVAISAKTPRVENIHRKPLDNAAEACSALAPPVELVKDAICPPVCNAASRTADVIAAPKTPPILRLNESAAVASPRSRSPAAHCTMFWAAGIVEPSPAPMSNVMIAIGIAPERRMATRAAKPTLTPASPYSMAFRGLPVEEIRSPVAVETTTCATVRGMSNNPEAAVLTPSSAWRKRGSCTMSPNKTEANSRTAKAARQTTRLASSLGGRSVSEPLRSTTQSRPKHTTDKVTRPSN